MAQSNYITKVAIVGASGNIGTFITQSLLATKRHTITALTRSESTARHSFPQGVTAKIVDYNKHESLVDALRGHDALVVTLNHGAPAETQSLLVRAAGEAGVRWILPNEWGPDTENEELVRDIFYFRSKPLARKEIAELGKSSFIAVCTGFWFELALSMPKAFGIDFGNREMTFFDEGFMKTSTTTYPQVGRAVAALLSLPIKSNEDSARINSLEDLENRVVHINSFNVNQQEMFESALRVTESNKKDWTINKEPTRDRFEAGLKAVQEGKFAEFPKLMARVFYEDGAGDFETSKGTLNAVLELPKEDLDEATRRAMERAKAL